MTKLFIERPRLHQVCSIFHILNLFFFPSHDPKPQQSHQISRSRANTRSQTCVKCRGRIICIKRNTDVNTGDLKILHTKNIWIRLIFIRCFQFLQNLMWFAFNLMFDWRAMTDTVHLAPWSEGHSLSVQCYDFGLQAILFL